TPNARRGSFADWLGAIFGLGIMCLLLPNIGILSTPSSVANVMDRVTEGNPRSDEHLRLDAGTRAGVRAKLNNPVARRPH
ncbi:MAG: hypothetical protein ACOYOF_20960, partial [Verrucomicrobiaceae bacterium]